MVDEKEILKKLVVEERDVIKDLDNLVTKSKEIFSIEKPTGRVIFKNFMKLTDGQRITILLIGKYFAAKLGLIQDISLSVSEIGKELGRPPTTLSGPIKELLKKGYVEKLNKKYVISYHRIHDIFDTYLPKT